MKSLFDFPQRALTLLFTAFSLLALISAAPGKDWDVQQIDRWLARLAPGQEYVQVGDMEVAVTYLNSWRNQLAGSSPGGPAAAATATSGFTFWTGGNVYYTFDVSVSPANRKIFVDSAALWATFANLHFTQRTSEPNYLVVSNNPSLGGGLSYVGMIGGPQLFQIGSTSWNHGTVCHELGHALGLVHEQQRSDRDSYVTILTGNILPGQEGNFVKLSSSQNYTGYDFMSVMHYGRNAFSIDDELDTIQPLPAYIQYLDVMGEQLDYVLSANDRQGMAAIYGAGPGVTNIVTNTQDSGPGSLRAALYYAVDHPGTTISFNIPTADPGFSNNVFNIRPTDGLPSLVNATVLDGGTQPTNSNLSGPEILIDGALCWTGSVYPSGFKLTGTNNTMRSLVVNNFPAFGVLISGSNAVGNVVAGCYLGIDPTGSVRVTNGIRPIQIELGATSNVVGGVTPADRNIISGSRLQGMVIRDEGTRFNSVRGNYIGLNASGGGALPNTWAGLEISDGAQSNLIGGYVSAAQNVISGNAFQGILISDSNSIGNVVAGNFIGLNAAGGTALPNGWSGVEVSGGAHHNTVGGLVSGARNVISGNTQDGVYFSGVGASNNRVLGNYVGLNPSGASSIGNGWSGVELYSGPSANSIEGNVIGGNSNAGILVRGATTIGNAIRGNLVGLNAAGNASVSNAWSGIYISDSSSGNIIGGTGNARNFISGNGNYGVLLVNASSNQVVGNTIGLNISNTLYVPNAYAGVSMFGGASANQIGGLTYGAANLIVGNGGEGIQLSDANTLYNTVRGNSVVSNASFGIGSYNGANASLAAPVLTSAVLGANTVVRGTLTSLASLTFQIDFYSNPVAAGSPEGMTYLGAYPVTTSAGGTATFTNIMGARIPAGRIITATATDPSGNTSIFSAGATVTTTSTPNDGIPDAWRAAMFGGAGATTNSTSCATCDPDGDGMSNRGEFYSGTNPTNAASVLKLTALNPAGAGNIASLPSASGVTYRIEARDDFAIAPWSLVVDQLVGTGSSITITDTNAVSLLKRFYRAAVLW